MKYELNGPTRSASPLRKLVVLIVTLVMVGLALMFSAMLLVVMLVVGTIAFAYLWWKTRALRKQLRMMRSVATPEARRAAQASNDGVFEGEVIRVVDPKDVR
jgi:O-antigen/teichoic acid export membrane protein